jgi:hypothetical protein
MSELENLGLQIELAKQLKETLQTLKNVDGKEWSILRSLKNPPELITFTY